MAEIGTVIAIIQIAARVIELSRHYIGTIRDAPSEIRSILLETSMLQTVLKHIEFLTSCNEAVSTTLSNLSQPDGPIQHCQKILTDLVGLFPADVISTGNGDGSWKEKRTSMIARLAWPLKEPKAQKLLQELGRYKSAINLALTTDSAQDIKEIRMQTAQTGNLVTKQHRLEFLHWLRPTEQTNPSRLHNLNKAHIVDGTCTWMLRMPEWTDWLAAKYRCLWVHGIPGAGKTVLASYLVREVQNHCPDDGGRACAYYYCYFVHNQDEAAPLLRWLVDQLCRRTEAIPACAYKLFEQGCEPSIPDLLTALSASLDSPLLETFYVIVDAADESKPREQLLKVLRDLATDSRFSKLQLLVTSREYIDIERVLEGISTPISMNNTFVAEDIHHFIRSTLEKDTRFKRWPRELIDEAETTLCARAKGMFRWVVCQLDRLRRMTRLRPDARIIRDALATLPKDLDSTYERIFLDIPEEERTIVQQCLQWIDHHGSLTDNGIPLAILLQAIGSCDDGTNGAHDTAYFDEEALREACGCLIQISPGYGFNVIESLKPDLKQTQIVSFAHYTVLEFLESDRIETSEAIYFGLGSETLHNTLRAVLLAAHRFSLSDSSDMDSTCDAARFPQEDTSCLNSYSLKANGVNKSVEKLTGDFRSYCAAMSIFVIKWTHVGADLLELSDLVFTLLDPSMDRLKHILHLVAQCAGGPITAWWAGSDGYPFWTLSWETELDPATKNAMLLFLLFIIPINLPPAKALIQRAAETLGFLHEPLRFRMRLRLLTIGGRPDNRVHEFNGPMAELFAQCLYSCCLLKMLLDLDPNVPDPTRLLYSYLESSEPSIRQCDDCRTGLLRRILNLGADPNGVGYATTPLHIAVATCQYDRVETLLRAGADPNRIGSHLGIRFRHLNDRDYHRLDGLSALFVCQGDLAILFRQRMDQHPAEAEESIKVEWPRIQALLVQHGARSFSQRPEHNIPDGIPPPAASSVERSPDKDDDISDSNEYVISAGPERDPGLPAPSESDPDELHHLVPRITIGGVAES